jgi:uncharacterized protein YfkK (UPF0435 family)
MKNMYWNFPKGEPAPINYIWDGIGWRKRIKNKLSPKEVTALKKRLKQDVRDSDALFEACWREVMVFAKESDIYDYNHLKELYNSVASQKVNNPRSRFYIYG